MAYPDTDFNAVTRDGVSALHMATYFGHPEIVDQLLAVQNRKEVNRLTNGGFNALHIAVSEGDLGMVKKLAEKGADLKTKTTEGHSPLQIAIQNKHVPTAQYLLESVIHSTVDQAGANELQAVCVTGNAVRLRELLQGPHHSFTSNEILSASEAAVIHLVPGSLPLT